MYINSDLLKAAKAYFLELSRQIGRLTSLKGTDVSPEVWSHLRKVFLDDAKTYADRTAPDYVVEKYLKFYGASAKFNNSPSVQAEYILKKNMEAHPAVIKKIEPASLEFTGKLSIDPVISTLNPFRINGKFTINTSFPYMIEASIISIVDGAPRICGEFFEDGKCLLTEDDYNKLLAIEEELRKAWGEFYTLARANINQNLLMDEISVLKFKYEGTSDVFLKIKYAERIQELVKELER